MRSCRIWAARNWQRSLRIAAPAVRCCACPATARWSGREPDMGGAELAAQFADCRPGVPVLCMSGYSAMVWPGADAEASYLQKPFTPEALLTRVRALLDRSPIASAPIRAPMHQSEPRP